MNESTIVAMIATSGTEEFLQNALPGLTAAGIDPHIVYVARPDNAGEVIDPVLRNAGAHGIPFTMFCEAPPALCWGFTSIKATDVSRRLLDTMLDRHDKGPLESVALDEQVVCNAIVAEDPSWISQIYSLPEALFLNGLNYRGLLAEPAPAAPMHGRLTPFTFHANWTTELGNKQALMVQTGTWLLSNEMHPACSCP